ncbi:MAG: aryl-sulfate sulfohydrolase [Lentisphaerae bacterium]|nr:aryl-sulfate sulfohydrolase [Lentisphaerota bacterium]
MRRMSVMLAVLGSVVTGVALAAPKPNVLLIYTDDHGWADLGAQGVNGEIRTPNLDRLAADGVRFTRGYVTAPQCTPSRAGVITGMYQNRFGVEHNGIAMQREVVTLPERLRDAGYVTGISGKWHLDVESIPGGGRRHAARPDLAPMHQGFDEYFTGTMRDYEASHALDGTSFPDAPRKVTEKGCRVVIQTEAALSFLNRRAAKPTQPWFLYLGYFAPHVPMESAEPWFSQTPTNLPMLRRQALSLIGAIDDGVGRIRAQLGAMGQTTNTLIFLIGDNGAPLGSAWDGSLNLPLKGQKGMLAEGGIRTPFVAAWPGRIPAGSVYNHPVISLDVAATALAQSGHHAPRDDSLDGVDLLPFLTGAKDGAPHETLYWRWMTQAAIQEYPHKLIILGDRERLLFDITTPEGENVERNLLAKEPEIAARLEKKLLAWTAGLKPPGLSTNFDSHHEGLFAEHEILKAGAPPEGARRGAAAEPGTVRGWLARSGTLAVKDGALVLVPDASGGRPFLTNGGLDLPGPASITMQIRAAAGGKSAVTWRTKQQPDFVPANSAAFDWPAGPEWREVKVELPVTGRLIHVRITPAKEARGIEIRSIVIHGAQGTPQVWNFEESGT